MKTYIIVNSKGEKLGSIIAAADANPATLNRIIKASYGRDAKAVKS